jgi:hypothetical protein
MASVPLNDERFHGSEFCSLPSEFGSRRNFIRIHPAHAGSFFSIYRPLESEQLLLGLLSALPNARPSLSRFAVSIEAYTAQFHSFALDELRLIDAKTLHRFLSSESCAIESEDRLLLLDSARTDFLSHLKIALLSAEERHSDQPESPADVNHRKIECLSSLSQTKSP